MTTSPFLSVIENIEAAFAMRNNADEFAASGDLHAALRLEKAAGERCSFLPGHWDRMATRYEALGDTQQAIECLLQALMLRPDDTQAFSRFRAQWRGELNLPLSQEHAEILNTLSQFIPR